MHAYKEIHAARRAWRFWVLKGNPWPASACTTRRLSSHRTDTDWTVVRSAHRAICRRPRQLRTRDKTREEGVPQTEIGDTDTRTDSHGSIPPAAQTLRIGEFGTSISFWSVRYLYRRNYVCSLRPCQYLPDKLRLLNTPPLARLRHSGRTRRFAAALSYLLAAAISSRPQRIINSTLYSGTATVSSTIS